MTPAGCQPGIPRFLNGGPEARRASGDFWMSGRTRDRRPASAEALPTLVCVASLNLMPELHALSADGHKRPPACR
jgi:hypothetical protein